MFRTPFIFIFFMLTCYMSGCESMPANFHQPQATQADQRLNNVQHGYPAQKSRALSTGEVPFGQGNPLPYSPEIQERILEGVNEMVGDIAAEVINTLEMFEMKKEVQRKHQRRARSAHHHQHSQNSEEYEQKSVK